MNITKFFYYENLEPYSSVYVIVYYFIAIYYLTNIGNVAL